MTTNLEFYQFPSSLEDLGNGLLLHNDFFSLQGLETAMSLAECAEHVAQCTVQSIEDGFITEEQCAFFLGTISMEWDVESSISEIYTYASAALTFVRQRLAAISQEENIDAFLQQEYFSLLFIGLSITYKILYGPVSEAIMADLALFMDAANEGLRIFENLYSYGLIEFCFELLPLLLRLSPMKGKKKTVKWKASVTNFLQNFAYVLLSLEDLSCETRGDHGVRYIQSLNSYILSAFESSNIGSKKLDVSFLIELLLLTPNITTNLIDKLLKNDWKVVGTLKTAVINCYCDFIVELSTVIPSVFLKHVSVLKELEFNGIYQVRKMIIAIFSQLLMVEFNLEYLQILLTKRLDPTHYVRSSCFRELRGLLEHEKIAKEHYNSVAKILCNHVLDKSQPVRRQVLDTLLVCLQKNPYGHYLNAKHLNESFESVCSEKRMMFLRMIRSGRFEMDEDIAVMLFGNEEMETVDENNERSEEERSEEVDEAEETVETVEEKTEEESIEKITEVMEMVELTQDEETILMCKFFVTLLQGCTEKLYLLLNSGFHRDSVMAGHVLVHMISFSVVPIVELRRILPFCDPRTAEKESERVELMNLVLFAFGETIFAFDRNTNSETDRVVFITRFLCEFVSSLSLAELEFLENVVLLFTTEYRTEFRKGIVKSFDAPHFVYPVMTPEHYEVLQRFLQSRNDSLRSAAFFILSRIQRDYFTAEMCCSIIRSVVENATHDRPLTSLIVSILEFMHTHLTEMGSSVINYLVSLIVDNFGLSEDGVEYDPMPWLNVIKYAILNVFKALESDEIGVVKFILMRVVDQIRNQPHKMLLVLNQTFLCCSIANRATITKKQRMLSTIIERVQSGSAEPDDQSTIAELESSISELYLSLESFGSNAVVRPYFNLLKNVCSQNDVTKSMVVLQTFVTLLILDPKFCQSNINAYFSLLVNAVKTRSYARAEYLITSLYDLVSHHNNLLLEHVSKICSLLLVDCPHKLKLLLFTVITNLILNGLLKINKILIYFLFFSLGAMFERHEDHNIVISIEPEEKTLMLWSDFVHSLGSTELSSSLLLITVLLLCDTLDDLKKVNVLVDVDEENSDEVDPILLQFHQPTTFLFDNKVFPVFAKTISGLMGPKQIVSIVNRYLNSDNLFGASTMQRFIAFLLICPTSASVFSALRKNIAVLEPFLQDKTFKTQFVKYINKYKKDNASGVKSLMDLIE
ncbi:hypothetical protein PCE1_000047 [Barthelona sp. PCE]